MDLEKSKLPIPRPIQAALDYYDKQADFLLGYRMVLQRKAVPGDAASGFLLEEEIRLVDGSVFTQSAEGEFEHAFIQLCLPMVRQKFRTVQLSPHEIKTYADGIDPDHYWNDYLVDVMGGELEARGCLDWLRNWIETHRNANRILNPEVVADALRRRGRRVPAKMHICYQDVWDPESRWFSIRMARGHQDMVAWCDEEFVESQKPGFLIDGKAIGYEDDVLIAAKMRLDDTLRLDCAWQKVYVDWAEGEYERLTEGMRFLRSEDVALLRSRFETHGSGITPEVLYEGLDKVFVRRRYWSRTDPFPHDHFYEDCLLPAEFSKMSDEWDYRDKALPLSGFSVEKMAELLL